MAIYMKEKPNFLISNKIKIDGLKTIDENIKIIISKLSKVQNR